MILGTARVTFSPHPADASGLARVLAGNAVWILFSATLEEVVIRGMATREIAARHGWPAGILAGGLYFGAMHLLNVLPTLTWAGAVWILVGGLGAHLVFTALLIRSRSLWLPIGVHAGWNFALGTLAGTTLSGTEPGFGLLHTQLSGPLMLTGGEFGPELSMVSLLVYAVAGIILLAGARGRGLPAREFPVRI
jgi:membrane protease YdiL (CAAX protease family)